MHGIFVVVIKKKKVLLFWCSLEQLSLFDMGWIEELPFVIYKTSEDTLSRFPILLEAEKMKIHHFFQRDSAWKSDHFMENSATGPLDSRDFYNVYGHIRQLYSLW